MNEHFLTDIEIKQFKCFTDFKASGFKRVNLIGGKNNIGKTALMEAMFINTRSKDIPFFIHSIISIKNQREFSNAVSPIKNVTFYNCFENLQSYNAKSKIGKKTIEQSFSIITHQLQREYSIVVNKQSQKLKSDPNMMLNITLIEDRVRYLSNITSDLILSELFQSVQKNNKETELEEFIKKFDESISHFKVFGNQPQCEVNGVYRDITEFGDGLKSFISIICALYVCKDGYLFIDEIDNGIYYEHFDRLWEIILTLSKQTNCQVFATTHSKEMLESFARVSKKLDEQDISYTLLVKNKKQELTTISLDYKDIVESLITHDFEVR